MPPPQPPTRGCLGNRCWWKHRLRIAALALIATFDALAVGALASNGHSIHLVLCLVRMSILAVGFVSAVQLASGATFPSLLRRRASSEGATGGPGDARTLEVPLAESGALGATTPFDAAGATTATISARASQAEAELNRLRDDSQASEHGQGMRNLVMSLCFLAVTAQSTYTGIQVLIERHLGDLEAVCLPALVFCMNFEFTLLKGLVDVLTETEGVKLPGVHEHTLFYTKVASSWCRLCRTRIGAQTGGNEGFTCKDCADATGGPRGFQICLQCFRKHQGKHVQEGILRGDKGPKFIQELSSWEYVKRAIRLCRRFRFTLWTAVGCVVITQVARVLMPNYQGSIINSLIDHDRSHFTRLLVTFVSLSVVAMLFGSVQSLAVEIVQRRITVDMRTAMFESLMMQDIAFYDGIMTGQVTGRMTNDVAAVVQPVRQLLNLVLTSVLRLIGGGFMCLFTSWRLTVLACTLIGPVIYLTRIYAVWSKRINLRIRVSMADGNAVATEALRNIRTVRSFGADDLEVSIFRRHMDQALKEGMKDAYASAGVSAATQYLEFAAIILILAYGGVAVLDVASGEHGDLTVGQLITFNLYWSMLNNAITALNGVLNTLIRAASAAQRVFEIIDLEPDIGLEAGELVLRAGEPCRVDFEDVRFTYQMRPEKEVLKGLSFAIPAGATVAVVGRSGAGKSTLVSLLLRFYDPQAGRVRLNGSPLTEYSLRSYRKRVGVVTQETQVFCRPIRENLMYGLQEDEVTDEEVISAARMANAHEFIAEFDEGYRAMIGEGGVRLSGGQKQRLSIARALLRRPSLLLLDEATSALDAENEGKVQQALDDLVGNMAGRCSVMLVAHRLSTVIGADKIIVMDGGCVVEQGTHEELLDNGSFYAQLVRRQLAQRANTIPEEVDGDIDSPRTADGMASMVVASSSGQDDASADGRRRGKGGGKGRRNVRTRGGADDDAAESFG